MTTLIQLLEEIKAEVHATRFSTGVDALSADIEQALRHVPREEFVSAENKPFAYENRPLPIGFSQTISQPYIVAIMTALLELQPQDRVLEIGTGCGYQAAVLSRLVAEVYSVERVFALYESTQLRLQRLGYDNIHVRYGDGHEGWAEFAPYDAVIVTAAASRVPPALIAQLKTGRHMLIPLGTRFGQELIKITKRGENDIQRKKMLDVAFVPLTTGCIA